MKKIFLCSFAILLAISNTFAQMDTPLVDREIFFGNPEISSGQLSPDGKYVSFMKEHNGIMNLWVKPFDSKFEDAYLLTESASPILGYLWSDDSKYMLYVNDKAGDENLNIFAVDPSSASANQIPESRNLTPMEEVTAQLVNVSKKDPDILRIGLNDRDKAWHDLYELRISTGELTLLLENNNRYTGYNFDWDEKLRVATRMDEEGNSQFLNIDENGKQSEIYTTNIKEQAYIARWTEDNAKCYLVSNKGNTNLSTCYLMDPKTGATTLYESDPNKQVDFGGLWINDNTRKVISTSYTKDKKVRHFKDDEMEATYDYIKTQFPDREIGFSSFTSDYKKMLIAVSGDKYATEYYFYDTDTKDLILQYIPRPELKKVEKYLSPMKAVSYKSSDGLEIPAYLSLPVGAEAKNLPTVIYVHGGPKGPRDYWGYDGTVQFLTNRGYAVLQPNFRASGGFGKSFMNAGDKQWGKLMQDDITWGVKYLVDQGIADEGRVAIMGGSYGGYATLAGLAFTPDVYACGIDIVGPSNLFTLLESIPPYWEAGRKWLYEMVGDPDTPEGQKLLKEASPLFSADKISKPLLIVQGANDPRVKQAESDQIVIALRDKGHPVEYICANDEGHGFRKPLNRMAMYAQAEKFLAEHVGGKHQTSIPDDVQETLKNITVNINDVVLKEKLDVEAMTALPSFNYDLNEAETKYKIELEFNGQKMPMDMTRTIKKSDGNWSITDQSTSAMGSVMDMVTMDDKFNVSSRMMEQMGQKMELKYSGTNASVKAMGKEMNIESDGLILCDGPGYDIILSNILSNAGDETSFNTVDMMTMKTKQMVVKHMGSKEMDGVNYQLIEVVNTENEKERTQMFFKDGENEATITTAVIPAMENAKMTITKI